MSGEAINYNDLDGSQKATLKMAGLVLAKEKSAIQLLTFKTGPEAIFSLKDEDWKNITGLDLRYRSPVEDALRDYWDPFVQLWDES